jgi:signal recognition particle GTPase
LVNLSILSRSRAAGVTPFKINLRLLIQAMPLVVMVGIPSSGKTTLALKLKKFLETTQKRSVVHLNEEILHLEKDEYYKGK